MVAAFAKAGTFLPGILFRVNLTIESTASPSGGGRKRRLAGGTGATEEVSLEAYNHTVDSATSELLYAPLPSPSPTSASPTAAPPTGSPTVNASAPTVSPTSRVGGGTGGSSTVSNETTSSSTYSRCVETLEYLVSTNQTTPPPTGVVSVDASEECGEGASTANPTPGNGTEASDGERCQCLENSFQASMRAGISCVWRSRRFLGAAQGGGSDCSWASGIKMSLAGGRLGPSAVLFLAVLVPALRFCHRNL